MRPAPVTAAARLRGTAVGLLTAALAVAAHGAAGGAPAGAGIALLGVLAITAGGLAATLARATDVRVLLCLLAAGQLVGHLMLGIAGHSHGGPVSSAPPMLVAHALAVVVGAVLIAAGDRLCRAVSRAVETAVRPISAAVPAGPMVVWSDAHQPMRSALLLAASMSHRGPPVSYAH
jgi:hypothetical protein